MSLCRTSQRFVELLGRLYVSSQLLLEPFRIGQAGPLQTTLRCLLPASFLSKYLLNSFEVCAESSRVTENLKKKKNSTQKCVFKRQGVVDRLTGNVCERYL